MQDRADGIVNRGSPGVRLDRDSLQDGRGDGSEQHCRNDVGVGLRTQFTDQRARMHKERAEGGGGRTGVRPLGGEREGKVVVLEVDERDQERFQALSRRCTGTEGWGAGEKRILEIAHVFADQRFGEAGSVAETPEDRSLADAGGSRDGVH